ncbi:MAG TPA: DUF3488 and transglutaminase-like domain-containing protein [Micromonosporaceae bacterium]
MNVRLRIGLVAGAATLLSAAPLSAIFDRLTWFVQALIVVALIAAVGATARVLQAPVWAQALGMFGTLVVTLAWLFPSGQELFGIVPTTGTFARFGELLGTSVDDIRRHVIPVPDTDALLFIAVAGIGLVAIVVDLVVVELRRPALAGLPMLAIYSVPVAVSTESVPPVPFVVAAAGFLWLLMSDNVDRVRHFGRRFTGDGRNVDVWAPSPLAAAGRRLAVVGIALAVLAPVAVPGMTGGLLNNVGGTGGQGDGNGLGSGRVDLFAALSGQLRQKESRELVKVTTTEPNPFYLRFGVADRVGSDGFSARNPGGIPVVRPLPDPRSSAAPGVTYRQYRASVEITSNFNMPLLPIYSDPVVIRGLDSSWLYEPDLQLVSSRRGQSKDKRYSFEYIRAHYTPEVLDAAPPLPRAHSLHDLIAVPRVPEVEALVAELTEGAKTDYRKVRSIYDFFSRKNGFRYRLSTVGGTSGEDIVDFLTHREGFCQQYAAAMAWLVRAAGIPARVAFGFTNGTRRERNAYVLTNFNLHAWTEVYFHGIGWVPFDPTPAANVPGSTRTEWAPDPDAPPEVDPTAGPSAAPGATPDGARDARDRAGDDFGPDTSAGGGSAASSAPAWLWWTAAGLLALLLLLAMPALTRIALRRRRHPRSRTRAVGDTTSEVVTVLPSAAAARAQAHAAWDELTDTMIDHGIGANPSETPRALIHRMIAAETITGPAVDAVRLLGTAEERARYARGPMPADRLGEALVTARQAIAAGTDRRTRVMAALLPPSVLLRWRSRVMDTVTAAVALTGRIREVLARLSPRRLLARHPG